MARIATAKFDRKLTIQRPVRTREPKFGTHSIFWEDLATVWAEVQDALPSRAEALADGIQISRRPCRVRIRYRDDVSTQMRLFYHGRTLRILSLAEYGRREAIEMMAEELTTAGEEP